LKADSSGKVALITGASRGIGQAIAAGLGGVLADEPCVVVDCNGRRFFDEGAGLVRETWEKFPRDIHFLLPDRTAYAILDAALLDIPVYGRAIRSELPPLGIV